MRGVITTWEHEELLVGSSDSDRLSFAEADSIARIESQRPGFCKFGSGSVKLAQYAGLVDLGSRVLEVLPKVERDGDLERDRGVFLRLLHATKRVPIFSRGVVGHSLAKRPLLHIFISAFLDELSQLVRAGLFRRY